MASNPIPVEPRYPLGDAAGLLEYRRTATGMNPITPAPVGHVYIAITCTLRGFGGGAAGFGGPGGGLDVRISPQRDPRIPFEFGAVRERDPDQVERALTRVSEIYDHLAPLVDWPPRRGTCPECAAGAHHCTADACYCADPHRCSWTRTEVKIEGNE